MSKPIILAVAGTLVGIVVAFGLFTFVLGGNEVAATESQPEVVSVPGKIGPHITLADRVFNLRTSGTSQVYLKLQTIVEFETTDPRWLRVLTGCGASSPQGAVIDAAVPTLVSAVPGGPAVRSSNEAAVPAGDPCEAEHKYLMDEFERQIGTGRQLIEDAVTTIVTGHTVEEITTTAGKETLKAEIRVAVDEIFHGKPPVVRVLFLNFITQ